MGMFDYINYKAECWKCRSELDNFQSKDGPCELKQLEPDDVEYFYSLCHCCGEMNRFNVILDAPRPKVPYHVERL